MSRLCHRIPTSAQLLHFLVRIQELPEPSGRPASPPLHWGLGTGAGSLVRVVATVEENQPVTFLLTISGVRIRDDQSGVWPGLRPRVGPQDEVDEGPPVVVESVVAPRLHDGDGGHATSPDEFVSYVRLIQRCAFPLFGEGVLAVPPSVAVEISDDILDLP